MSTSGKRPMIGSVHGIVACAHPLAAQAGAGILRAGGNAFDAVAAVAAALNVAEPFMSGLAGMGIATCYIAKEKRVRILDFVTKVPEKLPIERFKDREDLARGPLACGAPGNLAGWCEMVKTYGRKSLPEVFAPAIAIARDGFPLTAFGTYAFNASVGEIKPFKAFYDAWAKNYTGGMSEVRQGQVVKQPDLARTYEAIASEGPKHLHGGRLGQAIIAHAKSLGGCLTEGDFERVAPEWQDPVVSGYRGMSVHSAPPPAESFQYLLTLAILDGFDLKKMEHNGIDHVDTVYRAIRLAAGVRIERNNPSPEALEEILSLATVERLRKRVKDGNPVDGPTEQWIKTKPDPSKEHTTSFSIADSEGNVVCLTQSLGAKFGCGVVVPGTGVCLNNFLYWGEVDPKGTNFMRPGGPLALPLAPSISTRDGRPVLALGTPGSYGICQTQTQVMVQHVDFGLLMQDAVEEPRARLWDGRKVDVESRMPAATVEGLRKRGHEVEVVEPWTWAVGGMHGISIDPATGAKIGGCDPRRDGYCVGS
ncbi:MAG: gamma-glutamyltranspeptidase [Alphaproteobacteria bacterium]|nr:gamma-glutamyltranspeptidase [Alphaproteobacteria bacterium]